MDSVIKQNATKVVHEGSEAEKKLATLVKFIGQNVLPYIKAEDRTEILGYIGMIKGLSEEAFMTYTLFMLSKHKQDNFTKYISDMEKEWKVNFPSDIIRDNVRSKIARFLSFFVDYWSNKAI